MKKKSRILRFFLLTLAGMTAEINYVNSVDSIWDKQNPKLNDFNDEEMPINRDLQK